MHALMRPIRLNRRRAVAALAALLLALACAGAALGEDWVEGGSWSYPYVSTPNGNALNLRAGPSIDAFVLAGIPYGAQVAVLDDLYGGVWVRCEYNGLSGYVASAYLSYTRPHAVTTPRPAATANPSALYTGFRPAYYIATVTPSHTGRLVHARYGPSTLLPVLRDYPEGYELHVYYQNNKWSQVLDPVGHLMGYMMTEFLTYVEPLTFGESTEETAPASTGDWYATPAPVSAPTPEPQTDSNTNG